PAHHRPRKRGTLHGVVTPAPLTDAPGKSILDHAQSNRITFFRTRRSTGWHGQGLEPTPRIRRESVLRSGSPAATVDQSDRFCRPNRGTDQNGELSGRALRAWACPVGNSARRVRPIYLSGR